MNQFKDVFTGRETRRYKRATSSQKCVRAGGKHNDLENVGRTARHHTFFEMLGNFSFGDYFKADAIAFAWEWLTRESSSTDALVITVFGGDRRCPASAPTTRRARLEEGHRLRRRSHLRPRARDNFWMMGETGPLGPCTEIHYFIGDGDPDPSAFGQESGARRQRLDRDLEPGVHAVRAAGQGRAAAAAAPVDRHRRGPRARCAWCRTCAPTTTPICCGRSSRRRRRWRRRRTAARTSDDDVSHARARRPRARHRVPDRRRRVPRQRGTRLRAAPDHAARHPSRRAPGLAEGAFRRSCARRWSTTMGGAIPSWRRARELIQRSTVDAEDDALPPHARSRHEAARRGDRRAARRAASCPARRCSCSTTPSASRSI